VTETEKNPKKTAVALLNGCRKASAKWLTVQVSDLVLVLGEDEAAEMVEEYQATSKKGKTAKTVTKLPRGVLVTALEEAVGTLPDEPEEPEDSGPEPNGFDAEGKPAHFPDLDTPEEPDAESLIE